MNNSWKYIVLLFTMAWFTVANAGVKVTGLDWLPQKNNGRFVVNVSGNSTETPEWSTKANRLSLVIPGAKVDKGIVRYVGGIRLAAANVTGGVLTTLTFLNGGAIAADNVSINLNDNRIEVVTEVPPGARVTAMVTPAAAAPETPARKPAIIKSDLGEDFLKKLEAEENAPKAVAAAPVKVIGQTVAAPKKKEIPLKDEIKNSQAAPARSNDGFSIATYAGKFVAFLGVVLMFFWAVVQMMKKGVLSKGKLGFLNGSSLVQVLSTTYVAPKRSLLLVKAHNQVFLVAASEGGFEFLSEVKDVPGLVKEGEKFITGDNFDDVTINAVKAEEVRPAPKIKIKEDIYQSIAEEVKPTAKVNKDIARFSDELKKKVKNLKAMQ